MTIQIAREETRCRYMGYFRLATSYKGSLYASADLEASHRQDSTYHVLCYTSRIQFFYLFNNTNIFLYIITCIKPINLFAKLYNDVPKSKEYVLGTCIIHLNFEIYHSFLETTNHILSGSLGILLYLGSFLN